MEIYKGSLGGQYLVHHGIQGQKWGERNGPPYPLDYSDYSKEERKLNKYKEKSTQRIEDSYDNKFKQNRKFLSAYRKKMEKYEDTNEKKYDKFSDLVENYENQFDTLQKQKEAEEYILDIMDSELKTEEQKEVAKTIGKSFVVSAIASAATSGIATAVTGNPWLVVGSLIPDLNETRTEFRLEKYLELTGKDVR